MTKEQKTDQRKAVLDYYERSEERGYWGYLRGRCHYGYSPENDSQPFEMETAQIRMEYKLGETLNLAPGASVLDAGSGYGPVARTLAQAFQYNVTGIDLILPRLQRAAELDQQLNIPIINLVNADYHLLPFANESFDGVYTMETLVHAKGYEAVLAEFFRVLKPGGKVVLFEYSIPDLNSIPSLAKKMATKVIEDTGMTSLPHFTHGSFEQILSRAGFVDVSSEDISCNVYRSWFYMWKFAIRFSLEEFMHGRIGFSHIPGSMWIWPARRKLGYNISQASKPK